LGFNADAVSPGNQPSRIVGSGCLTSDYDELALVRENAVEFGLPFEPPFLRRAAAVLADGRRLSALVWGSQPAEVVLLHGGGQNAHTWDTVALAMGRSLVAIDLPGHGHSDEAATAPSMLETGAQDVAAAIEQLAPTARMVVGMSLGGLTAILLDGFLPFLIGKLVLVDILPDQDPSALQRIRSFLQGPDSFDDIDQMTSRAVGLGTRRSAAAIRRGILHNTMPLPDGRLQWRHRRSGRLSILADPHEALRLNQHLWEVLAALAMPLMLVRGLADGSVVTLEHELRFRRLQPTARVEHIPDAGHSIQGDQPLALARLLADFLGSR
jgi:pimeloyl-ACP methyl ester carboxylesterase